MHNTTALLVLKEHVRSGYMTVTGTTFMVPRYPMLAHHYDVREAFVALADACGHDLRDLKVSYNFGVEVWCKDKLFEKLFKVLFVNEKITARDRSEGSQDAGRELPNIFVGAEKTQVRQIPLSEHPPWPFKFLLELGGMIVVKTPDKRSMLLELRQFVNNHPQFQIGVEAKECPDGSVAVFTWWFREVGRLQKRKNLNVPS